jgi:hypothetical protein
MNLEEIYQNILEGLKLGHRSLKKFSPDELAELNGIYQQTLQTDPLKLEKILCIIEHSSSLYAPFEKTILETLALDLPDHLRIFALNCARKHIIQERFKRGQRLHYDFLEALKKLLHSSSPEVVEWTLRTIEECGNQGVYFLKEFDKIKPAPWKWFNPHYRAVREIIALLERRWSRFEKL